MHDAVMKYVEEQLRDHVFEDKSILDVGSLNVNGSLREGLVCLDKLDYTGIDMCDGPDVDIVTKVEDFNPGRQYDYVFSASCLEHCKYWKLALTRMKELVKPGGYLLVTTHSPLAGFHAYPSDYWRWTPDQWRASFTDMEILNIVDGCGMDVMVLCKKPLDYRPCALPNATPVVLPDWATEDRSSL
jgi:SAM-dependent methyltransferase